MFSRRMPRRGTHLSLDNASDFITGQSDLACGHFIFVRAMCAVLLRMLSAEGRRGDLRDS